MSGRRRKYGGARNLGGRERRALLAAAFSPFFLGFFAPAASFAAESGAQAFDIHPGQTLTFVVTILAGKVVVTPPRASKSGAETPKDSEMTVSLSPRDKTMYEQITVVEKTSLPVDFVATGLVGNIKIDERVLCGRLDAPASSRIGAANWRVRLHDFEVGKGGANCE
jgi:hypothetical protein